MREPHLLRVTAEPAELASLAEALGAEGMRLGWLELGDTTPGPVPVGPAAALALDVLRAVAVGPGRVVTAKPLRGEPVLRDLLREHFRGCRLVLVAGGGGPPDLPTLEPVGAEGFEVRVPGEAARRFPPAALAVRLRRPRPWGEGGDG